MANITKTITNALSHQAVTHPGSVVGSALSVATKLAATIFMYHAQVETGANTNPGTFFVQGSGAASGNKDWATLAQYTASDKDAADENLSSASGKVLTVTTSAGFAAGDNVYIEDVGTLADSEWGKVEQVTGTTIELLDALTNAKDGSDNVYNDAEIFVCSLDLTAITRLRVVFQHEGGAGSNVHIKAEMVTGDSIG